MQARWIPVRAVGTLLFLIGPAADLAWAQASSPLAYFSVSPCRLLDSRGAGQGPALASGAPRIVTVTGGACGVPATARAIAANITSVAPTGLGNLRLYPGDGAAPATSALNFGAGQVRANNGVFALAGNGNGTLAILATVSAGGAVHVVLDVTGYFAQAGPGFVVAARVNPREINIYRVDQPNVPIQTIPDASFTSGNEIVDNTGERIGTHWGISGFAQQAELGIFTTSRPIVLGSQAGHEYQYLGYVASTPPRVFFRDVVASGIISIRSAYLDGTDSRVLLSGCVATSLVVPRPDGGGQIASAAGLALRCDKGAGNGIYYSDGVSPAVELPGTAGREPKVLTSTHLVLYNSGIPLPSLFTQSITTPFLETKLIPGGGLDSDEVHVNPAGIAWIRTFTSADALPYKVSVVNTANPLQVGNRFQSFRVPLWEAMSPDGLRFATIYQQQAGSGANDQAWVWQFDPTTTPVLANVTPGTAPTTVSDIRFLENGKILVTRGTSISPTGIWLHDADGSNVLQKGDAGLRVLGLRGDYGLFGDANSSGVLQSVNLAVGGGLWTIEAEAAAPAPSFVSPLGATPQYATYVNDLNQAWIATLDPDLGIKQRIDLQSTNLVRKVGEGVGNRVFLVLRREEGAIDQEDIVMVDLDTLVTTPIVSGPTSDYGLFFPN